MMRAILAILLVVCPALPALAAELEFAAGGEVEYDDNVFRSEEDEEDDILFRLRPGVRIFEDRGDDLNFSAGYEAPIEFSVDNSEELDDVDHIGAGSFEYHVNDRLDFFGREQFGYLRSTIRHGFDDQTVDPVTLDINDNRERVTTNDASLGANYHFSPRTTGRLIAGSSYFDSTRDDRAEVWSVSGIADAQYKLTLKHQIGAGAGYAYQDFGDREDIPGSQTSSYRVYGSWRWIISETLSLDLTAGPAYLETDQDDADRVQTAPELVSFELPDGSVLVSDFANCGAQDGRTVASKCALDVLLTPEEAAFIPDLGDTVQITNSDPSGESDEQFTAFADLVLVQRWSPTLATSLRYTRQQGSASGVGGTSIDDIVALSNTWDFAERWQLALRGDYVRRESAFEIAQTYNEVFPRDTPAGTLATVEDPLTPGEGTAFNSNEDVDIETNTWGVGGRITHLLFKTTSVYVQVRYSQQESQDNTLGADSDFENFLATFGVRHVFEPIPLW